MPEAPASRGKLCSTKFAINSKNHRRLTKIFRLFMFHRCTSPKREGGESQLPLLPIRIGTGGATALERGEFFPFFIAINCKKSLLLTKSSDLLCSQVDFAPNLKGEIANRPSYPSAKLPARGQCMGSRGSKFWIIAFFRILLRHTGGVATHPTKGQGWPKLDQERAY